MIVQTLLFDLELLWEASFFRKFSRCPIKVEGK